MGSRPGLAGRKPHEDRNVKLKNIGSVDYTGAIECRAGEVVEVADAQAKYLLSDECPGQFEAVVEEKKAKAGK